MSLRCLFGHKWDGCRCERCDEIRDESHIWNGCMCKACSKRRDEGHDYVQVEGKCLEKCTICSKIRESQSHKWNGCQCERCGEISTEGIRSIVRGIEQVFAMGRYEAGDFIEVNILRIGDDVCGKYGTNVLYSVLNALDRNEKERVTNIWRNGLLGW